MKQPTRQHTVTANRMPPRQREAAKSSAKLAIKNARRKVRNIDNALKKDRAQYLSPNGGLASRVDLLIERVELLISVRGWDEFLTDLQECE